MSSILRRERRAHRVRATLLAALVLASVAGCSASLDLSPPDATLPTRVPVTVYTPPWTPTPTPTPPPPPPPPPLTAPNAMGGQTDGGNTAYTPVVDDTGPQEFAKGRATKVNDYEYRYVVATYDQVLAIASRFYLQTNDVVRVNFPCSDPLNVQPGDVLDIRWPVDSEQVGRGC
ncbi:hypothetical protein KPL76_13670 [Subtercola sp. PAMC28395]|uniref:hypothetical protein n=1 Tax=Subtercola sp. PAMC28395 TaxID=2846775 RepID=UPI001C0C263E|nr:hypothetical protein [Subtercola sp. PAMC28395]QWT23719.1 hypothetical protein KPL76_13670 [Subtercola sp. PAMC28395]